MGYIVGLFLIFIVLLGYVLFLRDKFNYSFGKAIFYSTAGIMFIMSLFSFLNIVLVGFYAITSFGILYFIISIIKSIVKKDKSILNYFNNLPFFIFTIMYIVLAIVVQKIDILMGWDECSYWATMVKRLYYYNSYIGANNFHSMYYPPALTSFNYFVVKFLGFSDSHLYFAQYIFILSGLIFLIKDFKWDKIVLSLLILISSYVFLILLLKPYVLTLYSEIPLILLTGICLISLYSAEKKCDYYFVSILLCNITWIKSNGLMLCILIVLIALVQLINYCIIKIKKLKPLKINYWQFLKKILEEKKELLLVIISPFIATIIFKIFLIVFNIFNPQVANSGIKSFLIALLRDTDNSELIYNFANALSKNYNFTTFNLSTILLVVLIIIGFWFIEKNIINKDIIKNNKYICIAIFISFLMYAGSLLYAYCFLFSRGEANILASFDRYMNSFVGSIGIGLIGIISYLIANNKCSNNLKQYAIAIFVGIIIVTNIGDTYSIFKQLLPNSKTTTTKEIIAGKEIANKYKKYFKKDDKIGFIFQGDYGLTVWSCIYYMTPLKLYDPRFDGDIWSIKTKDSNDTINTVEISPKDYINKLKKEEINYLIVQNINDDFRNSYVSIFENDNSIEDGLYMLDYNKNKLIMVNMEEI